MKEILIDRLENQVKTMFDTLIEIEKSEQKEPMRELNNWTKTTLGMIFFNQVLMKSCWNNIFKWKLTQEQRIKYIQEVWEMTKEHYKNLYWYDSVETANNI